MLLRDKAGLTVEDLSQGLGITANAVRQHLTALERDGLVAKGETQSSGGRPEQLYELTAAGNELFPRHYPSLRNCSLTWCAPRKTATPCANALRAWAGQWQLRGTIATITSGSLLLWSQAEWSYGCSFVDC